MDKTLNLSNLLASINISPANSGLRIVFFFAIIYIHSDGTDDAVIQNSIFAMHEWEMVII